MKCHLLQPIPRKVTELFCVTINKCCFDTRMQKYSKNSVPLEYASIFNNHTVFTLNPFLFSLNAIFS